MEADVGGDGFDLARDDIQGNLVKALDAQRVLHRYRGDGDQTVYTEQREGAQVGLDAGTAAGVGSGDRHYPQRGFGRWRQRQEGHCAMGR